MKLFSLCEGMQYLNYFSYFYCCLHFHRCIVAVFWECDCSASPSFAKPFKLLCPVPRPGWMDRFVAIDFNFLAFAARTVQEGWTTRVQSSFTVLPTVSLGDVKVLCHSSVILVLKTVILPGGEGHGRDTSE